MFDVQMTETIIFFSQQLLLEFQRCLYILTCNILNIFRNFQCFHLSVFDKMDQGITNLATLES